MHHQSKRHARLRRMIRELNRERKIQAKKVDILCHDLVDAQRSFISRLETLRFAGAFYRSLLGVSDLTQILRTASEQIGGELPQVSVSFFLQGSEGCKEVPYEAQATQSSRLEALLEESVCRDICSANRINSLENLLALGLQVNAGVTGKYCLATIPLSCGCRPLGFIFLHQEGPDSLQAENLQHVYAVCPGFSEAIAATGRFSRFKQLSSNKGP
ncbi:MAG: hypothetical protein IIC50_03310 [Planctomycetes bacterium]|nr:hypothetical protein [Planctomycetota bacterium]